jgi:DNA-binding LacI/PurR family transcriptional regulator
MAQVRIRRLHIWGAHALVKSIRTMEEFSSYAGLSRPTVSKYFNDPDSVRKKTRDLIEDALKKSGFRPNVFAVNLNRRRSNIIGVIVPNSADPFYMALVRIIVSLARDAGYLAFVLTSDGRQSEEDSALATLKSLNVAGAIIAPLGENAPERTTEALGKTIPIVYVDALIGGEATFVGTDNDQSFGLIVDYLCRSGEAPCFFSMPPVNSNSGLRINAYRKAMERLGNEPQILNTSRDLTWDFEHFAYEQGRRLFEKPERLPSRTILCANDRLAFGLISAAFSFGLKVGHGPSNDIRIAGHDDHPLAAYACPPITTVAQNYDLMGRRAIELLLANLDDTDIATTSSERILLKADLKLRSSA